MREEIPQWCWYNGQLLFALSDSLQTDSDLTIGQFMDEFKEAHGLPQFNLKNQGLILSLMYGLLVVPKEIWEPGNSVTKFEFFTRKNFEVSIGVGLPNHDFLRLLRNAISHANFEIIPEENLYRLWNIKTNGDRNFEATITHGHLGEFIAEVGKYFINQVRPADSVL